MLNRSSRYPIALLAILGAVGCSETPITSSTGTPLEITLEQLAAESNSNGDAGAAAAFSGAALALRLGVEPTDIAVGIDGEVVRYLALVTGVAQTTAGVTTIRRNLVAWSSTGRPVALLDIGTLGDAGAFSGEGPRAEGTWTDLRRGHRYVATDGAAGLAVNALGEPCAGDAGRATDFRCVFARYGVTLDGLFRLVGTSGETGGPAKRITISESGVAGVVITRVAPGTTRGAGR